MSKITVFIRSLFVVLIFNPLSVQECCAEAPSPVKPSCPHIVFFGFPRTSTELCNTEDLRVSVANDSKYLMVQAVLWKDERDGEAETEDGRKLSSTSSILLDLNGDGCITPRDREYHLNPWPQLQGLHYSIVLEENASTPIQRDSKGRGSLSFVVLEDGRRVRVDTFVIPLAELGLKVGQKFRLAYWGRSQQHKASYNSIGESTKKYDYPGQLEWKKFSHYVIKSGCDSIPIANVPEGREAQAKEVPSKTSMPAHGKVPPEFTAEAWFNLNGQTSLTLGDLKGKVVMIDFWATWCGPCLAGVPKLNALLQKYGQEGLVLVALAEQSPRAVENYVREKGMTYIVGAGSQAFKAYGVAGFPQSFLLDRNGCVVWDGHPEDKGLEAKIQTLLKQKP